VGLPNVIAGRFVVPELLQDDATPENVARAAQNLFDDVVTRRRLDALFAGFAQQLTADSNTRVADAVMQELATAGVAC
jgi:lipid-A-disaccharide synthase